MIQLIRVDYRLLHGQVAIAWTAAVGADCLLIVSDTVKNDSLRLNALKLAKPAGVKVVVKSLEDSITALKSGVTDKYKLFIICETIEIAKKIMEVTGINKLNIGNTPYRENTKQYGKSANLTTEEVNMLKDMTAKGMDIYIQMVPIEKSIKCKTLFK